IAVISTVAAAGPPLPKGPTSAGAPNHTPGAIAGNARCAAAVGPAGTAGTSGAPNWSDIVIPIGTVLLATMVNASAWVATSPAGRWSPFSSGSGTVVGLKATTGKVMSSVRRASTKTSFWLTPRVGHVHRHTDRLPGGEARRRGPRQVVDGDRRRGEIDRP